MHGLVHGLINDWGGEIEQASDAHHGRGAQVGDVVLLIGMQPDRLHQRDVDFISDRDRARERRTVAAGLLGHGDQRRDVIAGMRIVRREECVVKIKLAHRGGVGPGGPFRGDGQLGARPKRVAPLGRRLASAMARAAATGLRLMAASATPALSMIRAATSSAVSGAIIGMPANVGQFPRELPLARQALHGGVDAHLVLDHRAWRAWRSRIARCRASSACARSTTGTSIILPSIVIAPTPWAVAFS